MRIGRRTGPDSQRIDANAKRELDVPAPNGSVEEVARGRDRLELDSVLNRSREFSILILV